MSKRSVVHKWVHPDRWDSTLYWIALNLMVAKCGAAIYDDDTKSRFVKNWNHPDMCKNCLRTRKV